MASLVFVILAVAYLTSFHGILASPYGCSTSPAWPKNCANKPYCFKKTKDYPSTDWLKTMLEESVLDLRKFKNSKMLERPKRSMNYLEGRTCRQYHMRADVRMIKDVNNVTRYVVQVPDVVQQTVEIRECKRQVQLSPMVKCEQTFTPMKFLVTSCDGKGLEFVEILHGIPAKCSLSLSMSNYNY